jgi:hypothetical protein
MKQLGNRTAPGIEPGEAESKLVFAGDWNRYNQTSLSPQTGSRPAQPSPPAPNIDMPPIPDDPKAILEMLNRMPRLAMETRGSGGGYSGNVGIIKRQEQLLDKLKMLGLTPFNASPGGRGWNWGARPMTQAELNERDKERQKFEAEKAQSELAEAKKNNPQIDPNLKYLLSPEEYSNYIASKRGLPPTYPSVRTPKDRFEAASIQSGLTQSPVSANPLDRLDQITQARDIFGNEIQTADMLVSGGVKLQKNQRADMGPKDFGGLQFRNVGGQVKVVGKARPSGAKESDATTSMGQKQPRSASINSKRNNKMKGMQ